MARHRSHPREGIERTGSWLARVVTAVYLVVAVSYLVWRATNTLNTEALWLSVPFYLADIAGFVFFLLFAATVWTRVRRYPPEPQPGLTVDVFIATYNEPAAILRPTIVAALEMDYPHATYVLDDGRRDEVRRLCEELGARYLTRADNKGAKAGNINAALPQTNGDLIAIFDADHVPYANFLTELLGYFRDPSVAFAQAPQAYYNLDSFQHEGGLMAYANWHEQSVFYDRIMPGKDRWNAAFWCGSSAIIRRTALTGIGGVDTRTVTEDMHTAMSLHAEGWRSVYHDRVLAVGVAPDDVETFLGQRLRWAQGAAQILRFDNPLRRKGLSWRQRLAYLTSVLYVTEYVPKAIYLFTPIVALTVGVLPMTNMGWNLLFRFLPYYALGFLATMLLAQRAVPPRQSERYHLLKMGIMLRSLLIMIWPRPLKFRVTRKTGDGRSRLADLGLIRMQIGVGIASLVAAAWALAWYYAGASWQLSGPSLAITVAWALVNGLMVLDLVHWVLRRPHRRALYRFRVDIPVSYDSGSLAVAGRIRDLSPGGIGWTAPMPVSPGTRLTIGIGGGRHTMLQMPVRIASCTPGAAGYTIGASVDGASPDEQRALILFLFHQIAPQTLDPEPPTSERKVLPFPAPEPEPAQRAG